MARNASSKLWVSSACYLALGAFATLASGIPVVGSGPFSLAANANTDIYTAPASPAQLAAVTVGTQAGSVRARTFNAGAYANLGVVPATQATVFEGPFPKANLIANVGNPTVATSGTFEVRAPTDGTDTDRFLGGGRLTLGGTYASFTAYGSYDGVGAATNRTRMLAVDLRANPTNATVSATNAAGSAVGPNYVIDGGDWGFCSRGISRFTVTGNGAVPFAVYDPKAGCVPITGVCRAQTAGDTDEISVDGVADLEVTLANNGSGTVTLIYAIGASAPVTATIAPGASSGPISGTLSKFEWSYLNAGCTVALSIRGH